MPAAGWDVSQLSVGDRIGKNSFLRVSDESEPAFFIRPGLVKLFLPLSDLSP